MTQADDDKLSAALQRLLTEDPALVVERNEETGQTVLRGCGDTHLAVALERLARKFGVNVDTEDVRVPYRETIVGTAEAEGKVKKQSGGHGQYAVVNLRVSPTGRGDGTEFVDSIVGGDDPPQVHPGGAARRRGDDGDRRRPRLPGRRRAGRVLRRQVPLRRLLGHGVPHGGRAGPEGGAAKAGSAVLEPISLLTVTVPEGHQGDVLGDLNARRGRVSGTSSAGDGQHEIVALVPAAEIQRYVVELRSLTGGRGTFSAVHDHYDVLPSHLESKIKTAETNGH